MKSSVLFFINSEQVCPKTGGLSDYSGYSLGGLGVFLLVVFEIVLRKLVLFELKSSFTAAEKCFFLLRGNGVEIYGVFFLFTLKIVFVDVYFSFGLVASFKVIKIMGTIKHSYVHWSFRRIMFIYARSIGF